MIQKTIYNVLIIGAGNIGAFYDTPASNHILSYAHAFYAHEGFNLLGFIDKNREQAIKASEIWGGKAFSHIDDVFNQEKVDLVCVAVPDEYHFDVLKQLSNYQIKIIFTEKPLTKILWQAEEIWDLYKNKPVSIAVNYSRRFVPEFEKLKKRIEKEDFGKFLTGTGYYGKGLLHNGSHLIDLLRYLIGEITDVAPISSTKDYYEDDKSISTILNIENKSLFVMSCVDCRYFTIFEMDLLFEKKRIRIIDSGFKIEEFDIHKNAIFKDYKNMIFSKTIDTSLKNAMFYATENIYQHLIIGEKIKCSIDDGREALKACQMIVDKSE